MICRPPLASIPLPVLSQLLLPYLAFQLSSGWPSVTSRKVREKTLNTSSSASSITMALSKMRFFRSSNDSIAPPLRTSLFFWPIRLRSNSNVSGLPRPP